MMKSKTFKGIALATMVGTLFQLGGCINLNTLLRSAVYYAALEFVTDNDGIFDLFESGNVTAAQ